MALRANPCTIKKKKKRKERERNGEGRRDGGKERHE
jgi:hypothetical protein